MKQRSTTPVLKSFAAKLTLVGTALIIAVTAPIQMGTVVKADPYDDQINAIQAQIDQYEAAAGSLQNQANDLQQKVQGLNVQKAQIQAQVDLSQVKYDQLQAQIKQTEKDISDNKSALGETIANIYVDGSVSPLEMLASSKNIGDYVDKQQYQSSVRDELTKTISKIKSLKQQLDKQKADVEKVLADQKNSRDALAAKEAEQQKLLDDTKGEQNAYLQLSAASQAKQGQIREAQQAAIQAAIGRSGGARVIASGADGDYPWNDSTCPMSGYFSTGGADGNGGDGRGYGCRQCASYAAWRVAKETGYYPINWGNATNFPASARSAGYSTGYSPRAGSLGVMHASSAGVPEGHVVWVESVNGDGTLTVSQYNYNYGAGYGKYSKMVLSASIFNEYVYIK
ncbi:MAG: CHAP domain-containing protein [Candidatus Saccharibacteria bacterium]